MTMPSTGSLFRPGLFGSDPVAQPQAQGVGQVRTNSKCKYFANAR